MFQQVLAYALPVLGWWLLTGVINLAFAYKSQIEAWAESNPRLASLLKLSRALGFDPWNLLSSLKLFASKKLPDAQKADSPIARLEQRKADAKALGIDPKDPPGGSGAAEPKPTRIHFERPNDYPPDEPAECSDLAPKWRHPYLRFALVLALVGCDPRKPPCDESKLHAADKAFVARVAATCLLKYDSAEACPEYPGLKADHRAELRRICPQ